MNTPDGFIFLDTFENVNILNIWTRVTQYLTFDTLSVYTYRINSQSLEDTQVWYISQKYTLDKYTLEKYT